MYYHNGLSRALRPRRVNESLMRLAFRLSTSLSCLLSFKRFYKILETIIKQYERFYQPSYGFYSKVGQSVKLLRNTFQPLTLSFKFLMPQCFSLYSFFFSLTFSFLKDTSIFSHFSNPGQSKNYVSCIPRIPFKLQFVEQ